MEMLSYHNWHTQFAVSADDAEYENKFFDIQKDAENEARFQSNQYKDVVFSVYVHYSPGAKRGLIRQYKNGRQL